MGKGDLLIALEPAESLRHMHYMKRGAALILSSNPIEPPQVSMGLYSYPSLEKIKSIASKEFNLKLVELDSREIAEKAGNIIAQNSVMLGAALAIEGFPLRYESIASALKKIISKRYIDINIRALELGREEAKRKLIIF